MAQAAAIQATLINNYFTPLPAGASQPFIGGTEAAAATASSLNPYPFFNSVYQTNIPTATGEIPSSDRSMGRRDRRHLIKNKKFQQFIVAKP